MIIGWLWGPNEISWVMFSALWQGWARVWDVEQGTVQLHVVSRLWSEAGISIFLHKVWEIQPRSCTQGLEMAWRRVVLHSFKVWLRSWRSFSLFFFFIHILKDACSLLCFFFFCNFYLFICLFLAVLGLRFCARASSSCGEWGPLFIAVRGPLTIAASRCGAQAPDVQAQ